MDEKIGTYGFLVCKYEGKNRLEDPGLDGRIRLRRIFRLWDSAWTGLIWLGIGTGGGLL
jgi:hypothetical protein